MESFNFGAFDTNLGARIAAIPQEAQKQQTANMLQAMQMQGAMRQNEMSQMQLDEMKTDRAEMVKLQQDLAAKGGSPDLNQYADMLLKSPKHMKLGLELKQKLNDQARYAAIMGRTQPAAAPPMAPAVAPEPGSFSADVAARREADPFARSPERANMLPGVVAAPAGVNAMVGGGGGNAAQIAFKQQQRDALIGLGTTQSIAAARAIDADIALLARQPQRNTVASPGQIIYGPNGEIIATAPDKIPAPPSMVAEYTFAKTPDGGGFRGSYQDFVTARAAAARPPAQPRPEQPPVAVVDDTGKTVYVSREEALRRRMTPASAMEGLAPKEIQKREAALPAATSAVTGFETKSKSFVKDLETLRDHPGLSSITGIAAGRLPGVTAEGRAAQALYDKIVAKGGFQALQDLRDASKTGGALGNVSNQEGKQLTASFAAIDRRQDAPDVQVAINQAIADIEGARTRTREAYDSTYSYKSAAGQAAPTGAGKPSLADIFGGKKP